MKQHFQMFAAYNRWANALLYDAVAELSDEEFTRQVGAFFGSAMGTLNHLLTADLMWMKRFTGTGEAPSTLDAILHPDFAGLRAARMGEDARMVEWIDGLTEAELAGNFSYSPVTGPSRTIMQRLAPALAHLFNHQTHHRGQAHMILTVLGKPSVSLDLIYFQRTEEGRAFA